MFVCYAVLLCINVRQLSYKYLKEYHSVCRFSEEGFRFRQFCGGILLKPDENVGMALETVLLRTGEMDHMETLLRHYASDKSGLGAQEMLETVIHPLLDELEQHIVSEVSAPQDIVQLKAVIHQWIASRIDG